MVFRYFIIFIFGIVIIQSNAQKTTFDIIAMDKVIGEATIDKKIKNDGLYTLDYTFDAVIKFLFIKTTVDMDVKVTYQNNQMIKANVRYQQNDKVLNRTYDYKDGKYTVTTDGKVSSFTKKAFTTVMNFYAQEPVGVSEIFLEKQNEFAPLKSLGNNQYMVVVDGDECTYTYKNGKLQKAFIDATVNFHIIRKN